MMSPSPRDSVDSTRGTVVAAYVFGILAACGLVLDASRVARADSDEALVPMAPDAGAAPVSSDALNHAKEAAERSTRLRGAGDEVHAKVGDGLADEWGEAARDIELAVSAERMAAERRREAMRAQAQLQRTRTLVEEGIARLGRIRAELGTAASAGRASSSVDAGGAALAATAPATSAAKSGPSRTLTPRGSKP
jgi:hypothetical protein